MSQFCFALAVVIVRVTGLRDIQENYPVNDPLYKRQEGYLEAINVPAAWSRLWESKLVRDKVTVAVCDSGVFRHPDLVDNLVSGYNVVDYSTDTDDVQGHGTKMAGILGATINNELYIAGAADRVNIMPIAMGKVASQTQVIEALDYAIKNQKKDNIKVVLIAISCDNPMEGFLKRFREADAAGILTIVTAGNHGQNITVNKRYPCALTEELQGMLCVGALEGLKMRIRKATNFGKYLDIAAPGARILTITKDLDDVEMFGTSPAAALVAGVATMLYSISPDLSSKEVKKILKDTATKGIQDPTGKGILPYGRVNADEAVARLITLQRYGR